MTNVGVEILAAQVRFQMLRIMGFGRDMSLKQQVGEAVRLSGNIVHFKLHGADAFMVTRFAHPRAKSNANKRNNVIACDLRLTDSEIGHKPD